MRSIVSRIFYEIEWHPFDILRDEEYPFIFATLDGDMIRKRDGARGIYEAKTGTYNRKTLDAWEQGIPQHYFAQNCQQLLATGWNYVVDHASVSTSMDSEVYLPVERRFFRYFDLSTPGVRTTMATVKKCLIDFHYCCEHQIRPTSHLTWGGKYRS
jgi:YqaJ-like viral recombinase domain.